MLSCAVISISSETTSNNLHSIMQNNSATPRPLQRLKRQLSNIGLNHFNNTGVVLAWPSCFV
ncbi:uncharacterized protein J3R85_014731 [Psidium guajava]|nr:uncharacterized protein J3R85_014731 [Psidium guajava]